MVKVLENEMTFEGDEVKSPSYPLQTYPGQDQNIIFDSGHAQDVGWTSSDSGKGIMLSPSMTGVRIIILNFLFSNPLKTNYRPLFLI